MGKISENTHTAYTAIAYKIQTDGFIVGPHIVDAYVNAGCHRTSANNFSFELHRTFKETTRIDAVLEYDEQTHMRVVFPKELSEEERQIVRRRAAEELQIYKQHLRRDKIS